MINKHFVMVIPSIFCCESEDWHPRGQDLGLPLSLGIGYLSNCLSPARLLIPHHFHRVIGPSSIKHRLSIEQSSHLHVPINDITYSHPLHPLLGPTTMPQFPCLPFHSLPHPPIHFFLSHCLPPAYGKCRTIFSPTSSTAAPLSLSPTVIFMTALRVNSVKSQTTSSHSRPRCIRLSRSVRSGTEKPCGSPETNPAALNLSVTGGRWSCYHKWHSNISANTRVSTYGCGLNFKFGPVDYYGRWMKIIRRLTLLLPYLFFFPDRHTGCRPNRQPPPPNPPLDCPHRQCCHRPRPST